MCFFLQTYLQSITVRLEEWRVKRTDTEQWMHHRQLPPELRESIRKYNQYKWVATRGVEEEDLLKGLPLDLRREIKRHLCLELVRGVSHETPSLYLFLSWFLVPHPIFDILDSSRLWRQQNVDVAVHITVIDLF